MRYVVTQPTAHSDHRAGAMDEIAVTSLASAIYKTGPFQFSNQLTDFPRHFRRMISCAISVKQVEQPDPSGRSWNKASHSKCAGSVCARRVSDALLGREIFNPRTKEMRVSVLWRE